jgi:hypothetical protein
MSSHCRILRPGRQRRLRNASPAQPILLRDVFDHAEDVFELKHDGFKLLAHVPRDGAKLVPRRGYVYHTATFPGCGTYGDRRS